MELEAWLSPKEPGTPALLVCGTMNFGKRTDARESNRIIARALERQIPWFDTANAYNEGESERIVGRALRGRSGAFRIATKCGIGPGRAHPEGLAPEVVMRACEESLERLGVERIDLYYLHKPDDSTAFERTLSALEKLRAAGKIAAWGVSNHASWQIAEMNHLCEARGFPRPRVSQVIYNLLVRQLDGEYFRFARTARIHTTIYNPLAGGLLAGKGLRGKNLEEDSRLQKNAMYRKRYLSEHFFDLVEDLFEVAKDSGLTPVELAYAWAASRPGVDSILVGPATVEHLDAAVDGCAKPLPGGVEQRIDDLHRAFAGTDVFYAR